VNDAAPLVSILIPAYHERFFAEALASARSQSYSPVEIVVCDDSQGASIERIVAAAGDERIRYRRNAARRGFEANFGACFEEARGEFVKFLNDDDRLGTHCVEALAWGLRANPGVSLATSRRFVIDETGRRLPDLDATVPVSHVSCFIPGGELGNFVLMNMRNLIGEPSTAMFRRADFTSEPGGFFHWGGESYHCLADLSLWLRLLKRGAAYWCAAGLSEFRVHEGQEQAGVARLDCLLERHRIATQARTEGYLEAPAQWLAALRSARAFAEGTDFARVSEDVRARIGEHMRRLDEEIGRAMAEEAMAAPL